jgi:hypothetical protein
MEKQPMGTGFRFQKIMGWGPAVLILLGALLLAAGSVYGGLAVAMAGLVFAVAVKRRARRGRIGARAGADAVPSSGD